MSGCGKLAEQCLMMSSRRPSLALGSRDRDDSQGARDSVRPMRLRNDVTRDDPAILAMTKPAGDAPPNNRSTVTKVSAPIAANALPKENRPIQPGSPHQARSAYCTKIRPPPRTSGRPATRAWDASEPRP